jgi:F420-non-reducing hydrogenase small subunit
VEGVADAGAKFVSALASIIDAEDEKDVKRIVDEVNDEVGYLYRFSVPSSILRKRRASEVEEQ